MEFSGTFELGNTSVDEVWLALSDPVLIEQSLPGCEFLVEVDDENVDFEALREETADREMELTGDPDVIAEREFEEGNHYAALLQIGVGPVNPSFETVVTIENRRNPEMSASGEGSSGNSSFEMSSGMALEETDEGVAVEWETEAEVFGKIAQMGQRVINPVANRVVKRFFSSVQDRLHELQMAESTESADSAEGMESVANGEDDDSRGLVDRALGRTSTDSDDQ